MYCARTNEQGFLVVDFPQPQTMDNCPVILFSRSDYPTTAEFDSAIFSEVFFGAFFLVMGVYLAASKIGIIRKIMA